MNSTVETWTVAVTWYERKWYYAWLLFRVDEWTMTKDCTEEELLEDLAGLQEQAPCTWRRHCHMKVVR